MQERVFIAIPSGTGKPDVDCDDSLNNTILDLQENCKERPDLRFIHGNCYIALIRSLFAHDFIKTDCSHLFFWDDDVAAQPSALRRLIDHDRDIIVGPYPKKVPAGTAPENAWPVRLIDGVPDAAGLLESEMVATGFLLIKRRVIEAMYRKYADRKFYHRPCDQEIIDLFPTGILPVGFPKDEKGRDLWWGEDFSFSVMAKHAGFKIWLDPNITLIHAGRNVWRGSFWRNADGASSATSSAAA